MRYLLPIVDFGLHALITDLAERGMLDDVSIVVWGEFGRTPRIDAKTGGRHHWPQVGMALLAGGGMQTGQVIGQTDRHAAEATDRLCIIRMSLPRCTATSASILSPRP